MIHKSLETNAGKPVMQVTFCLPNSYWADKIHLVGDFNDWNRSSHPLARKKGERGGSPFPWSQTKHISSDA